MKLIIGILLLNLALSIRAEKVLFLLPFCAKSHKNVFVPLIQALGDRKHQVTVASSVLLPKPHPNVREIVPVPYDDLFGEVPNPIQLRKESSIGGHFLMDLMLRGCEKIYDHKDFRNLATEKFDLIIMFGYINDCFAGLAHKIGAPLVLLTTTPAPSFLTEYLGNSLPWSFVPLVDNTDEMTLSERAFNALFDLGYRYQMWRNAPTMAEIYRRRLESPNLPGVAEIFGTTSLILSNAHFALNYPRPLLPNVIEVGGMHCKAAKPLPKDLEKFLGGAEHGFIYFSMGAGLRTDQMTEEMLQIFFNVFSRLKQRVIWRWTSGPRDKVPSNVMLSKWVPQQDVLAHPKIRVFMSHGGLLSTQEASYYGVPIIGIPVYGDQDQNIRQAVQQGYGVMIEILDLSEKLLEDGLKTILKDPSYARNIKALSGIIKDQPQTPLDRAVFWTEYVMRHKGARHLQSAGKKLNYIQYHFLDVIGLALLAVGVVLTILFACIRFMYRKCCGTKRADDPKKKKQ